MFLASLSLSLPLSTVKFSIIPKVIQGTGIDSLVSKEFNHFDRSVNPAGLCSEDIIGSLAGGQTKGIAGGMYKKGELQLRLACEKYRRREEGKKERKKEVYVYENERKKEGKKKREALLNARDESLRRI